MLVFAKPSSTVTVHNTKYLDPYPLKPYLLVLAACSSGSDVGM